MISKSIVVNNPSGLHLRPAGLLCKEAMRWHSRVSLISKGTTTNAKSLLSVLAACVKNGDTIELICDGSDEKEAMEAIQNLIESGLE